MFRLIRSRVLALLFLLLLSSCEECLDVVGIHENTILIDSWITSPEITSKTLTSSINVSDEVLLHHEYNDYGDSIWDDCGNVTQSFRNSVDYKFHNFPIDFTTELNKQGEENGFRFFVRYGIYDARYNFSLQRSGTKNPIELLNNYELNNQFYPEILKVSFNQTQEPSEIKELYFVKNNGVIYIELNNGISMNLSP